MSYRTIAAALALEDVSIGERLVAFSLASYADAEHQTFVGNPAAATRAGLSRSQYLAAREQLVGSRVDLGGGRGRRARSIEHLDAQLRDARSLARGADQPSAVPDRAELHPCAGAGAGAARDPGRAGQ